MSNFDPAECKDTERQQEVYKLWKQRLKVPDIMTTLVEKYPTITASQIIDDIRACRANVKRFADENPFYLDERLRLILERVENLEIIQQELWSQYRETTAEERNAKTKLLDLIQKNEMEQAKIMQLLGNASEIVTKLEQATKAQQGLIQAVRDVTSTCPKCANELALKLKHMSVKKQEESSPPTDAIIN